jgi:hypothetical protein
VHYGNFPVFTATALLFLPFVKYRVKYVAIIFSCILGGIALILVVNSFGEKIRLGSKPGGFAFLSSRILHDIPEVIDRKCQDDPDFKLCELKKEIFEWSSSPNYALLLWQGRKRLNISWEELNDLSRELVFYSLKGFFAEHLSALVRNTYSLVSSYKFPQGFNQPADWFHRKLVRLFPDDLDEYEKSWQTIGKAKRGLEKLEMTLASLFRLSIMICLAYIGIFWKDRHDDVIIKLSIFAVVAVLLNAFIMSAIGGVIGRHQTKIGFLLIFPALALISRSTDSLRKRIIFYLKKKKS